MYLYKTKCKKTGKQHPCWRYGIRMHDGSRKSFTGFESKSDTLKLAAKRQLEQDQIKKGLHPIPEPESIPRQFDAIMAEYLAWGNAQGGRGGRPWGAEHARKREERLCRWKVRLSLQMMSDLPGCLPKVETVIQEWCAGEKPKAGKTISNEVEALVAFCTWASHPKRRFLKDNPLAGLAQIDTTALKQRRALTSDEVRILLKSCEPERQLLYEIAIMSGLRAGELGALRKSHVDIFRCGLRLDAAWTKNRKKGFQPLPRPLVERLVALSTDLDDDAPLLQVTKHPARDLRRDLLKAGLSDHEIDFHALRVAYITLVIEGGADVKTAQHLARHGSAEMTLNIYAKAREALLSAAVDRVGAMIAGKSTKTAAKRKIVGDANA